MSNNLFKEALKAAVKEGLGDKAQKILKSNRSRSKKKKKISVRQVLRKQGFDAALVNALFEAGIIEEYKEEEDEEEGES